MIAAVPQTAGPAHRLGPKEAPALDLPARFMLVSMLGFLALAVLLPWALPLLLGNIAEPHLLAFVHLNTLGIVAMIVVGASYQLVPVALQTPLVALNAGRASFWLLLAGVSLFIPGLYTHWLPAMGSGASLLLLGFAVYIAVIALTLRGAPRRSVVTWHIGAALLNLAGGVSLGVLLAFNEAGGYLGGLTYRIVAAHITLLFAGWIAVLLAGVAYRLVGMFTLAEDHLWHRLAWVGLAVMTLGAWLVAGSFALSLGRPVAVAGAAGIALGQIFFAFQLTQLTRARRRRGVDIHIPFALSASLAGVGAALLLLGGLLLGAGPGSHVWVAVVWLALAGLAETAIQGFFYKISTFLVWLHRYAPVAGRQRVPKLESMYRRRVALAGWALWIAGLLLTLAALSAASTPLARIAGLALSLGLVCFLVNVAGIAGHWMLIRVGLFRLLSARPRRPGALRDGETR